MVGGRDWQELAGEPGDVRARLRGRAAGRRSPARRSRRSRWPPRCRQGYDLNATWYGPCTITIPNTECYTDGAPWQPVERGGLRGGLLLAADGDRALGEHGLRAARHRAELGPEKVVDMAHLLGIRSRPGPGVLDHARRRGGEPARDDERVRDARRARRASTTRPRWYELANAQRQADRRRQPQAGDRCWIANDADLVTYALEDVVTAGRARPLASPIGPPQARPARRRTTSTRGSAATRRSSRRACGWATPQGEIPLE